MTTTTIQISNFVGLVQKGIDAWQQAGKLLMELQRIDGGILLRITTENPWLDAAVLSMFIQIGEGKVHPRVLLLPPMVASKVARMPLPEQAKMTAKPVQQIRREIRAMAPKEPAPTQNHRHQNAGLADKMDTVGFWKVTVMNGKAFMLQSKADSRAIPMVLDETSSCYIQVLSPTPLKRDLKPVIEDASLTPLEREYKQFRADSEF